MNILPVTLLSRMLLVPEDSAVKEMCLSPEGS